MLGGGGLFSHKFPKFKKYIISLDETQTIIMGH